MNKGLWPLCLLVASVLWAGAADRYVSTSGDDTTGDGTGWATAWRTLEKASTSISDGDTVHIGQGDYGEYTRVYTRNSTTWIGYSNATTRAMRFEYGTNTVRDLTFRYTQNSRQGEQYTGWGLNAIFLDPGAHHTTISNCNFLDTPNVTATNFNFDYGTQTISSPDVDFVAAGFTSNGVIYWGSVSMELYNFANRNWSGTIKTVAVDTLYMEGPPDIRATETNTSAWSLIQAGENKTGVTGIRFGDVSEGTDGPTNCVFRDCLFSNWWGPVIYDFGNGTRFFNNEVTRQGGNTAIYPRGRDTLYYSNYFHDCVLPIYYSAYEEGLDPITDTTGKAVIHPNDDGYDDRTNYWDYIVGYIHHDNFRSGMSNQLFLWNWFENIEQAIGTIRPAKGTGAGSEGFTLRSNVFIGFYSRLSGGQHNMYIDNNIFYKCAYAETDSYAATVGGVSTNPYGNFFIRSNAFISCGDHDSVNDEGWYTLANITNTVDTNWNFVAQSEGRLWRAPSNFEEPNGTAGGNPFFVDERNPRGPDGIPWTADDGFKVLPWSPMANISPVGVASVASNLLPYAHISFCSLTDGTASKFGSVSNWNIPWQTNPPFWRTSPAWNYYTPEPVGDLPVKVGFTASNSVSGTMSSNDWVGIRDFLWDFGDGSAPVWTPRAQVGHTYLVPGDYTVVLYVTNNYTNTDSISLPIKVAPIDDFSGDIFFVATNGNDGNAGTYEAPFLTIGKGISNLTDGDFLGVLSGYYTQNVEIPVTLTASSERRIVGYNAHMPRLKFKDVENWSVEGMQMYFRMGARCSNMVEIFEIPNVGDWIAIGSNPNGQTITNYWTNNTPEAGFIRIGATTNECTTNLYNYLVANPIPFTTNSFEMRSGPYFVAIQHGTNLNVEVTGTNNGTYADIWEYWENLLQSEVRSAFYIADDCKDILIENCTAYNCGGKVGGVYGQTTTGTYRGTDGSINIICSNNTWTSIGNVVFQIANGSNWLISGNTVIAAYQEGDLVRPQGENHVICDNQMINCTSFGVGGGHPDVWQLNSASLGLEGPQHRNVVFERNLIIGFEGDVSLQIGQVSSGISKYTNSIFRNNIYWYLGNQMSMHSISNLWFNNTFYKCGNVGAATHVHGEPPTEARGKSYDIYFYNNTFLECNDAESDQEGWYSAGQSPGTVAESSTLYADFNAVRGTGAGTTKREGTGLIMYWGTEVTNFGDIFVTESNGINGSDFKYVNPDYGDFRIQSDSPLRGAGTNLQSWIGFSDDYFGKTRPATNWTMGAIEYGAVFSPVGAHETLSRTPSTLSPECLTGTDADADTYTVSNIGTNWFSYTNTDDVAWITLDPVNDNVTNGSPRTVTVTYTTDALGAGEYNATITITGDAVVGVLSSPQTISVTLTVTNDPQTLDPIGRISGRALLKGRTRIQ